MSADLSQSLGEFLRQERERRGITIEQVASATKISVRLLHSLEADHFSDLPAKPFIRGFVTSYARFISLDPQEILNRFDDFIDSKVTERPSKDAGHSGYAFERREGEQSRTVLWLVMGSFVILGAVAILFLKPSLRHGRRTAADKLRAAHPSAAPSVLPSPGMPLTPPSPVAPKGPWVLSPQYLNKPEAVPAPSSSAAPVIVPSPVTSVSPETSAASSPAPSTSPSPAASASPTPQASASPVPVAGASPSPQSVKEDPLNSGLDLVASQIKYKVVFKAIGDVRVRYKVDDKPVMRFILRKDRLLVLRGQTAIRFQVSRGEALNYSLNGSASKPVSTAKVFALHRKIPTLVFAEDSAISGKDPFPNEAPLKDPEPTASRSAPPPLPPSP